MVTVRRLTKKDKKSLAILINEFYIQFNRERLFNKQLAELEAYKNIDNLIEETVKEYTSDNKFIVYVAEIEERIVGYICGVVKIKPLKNLSIEGYIEDWFVSGDSRSHGVGTKLYEELVKEFKNKKCSHIATDAYVLNIEAIGIYKKLGFFERNIGFVKKLN